MDDDPLRILLIDDDEAEREAVVRTLRAADLAVEVEEAATGAEGLERLRSGRFDCALLDPRLPDLDGVELLHAARTEALPTPVVVLSGRAGDDETASLLAAGAADSVAKSALSQESLVRAVRSARRIYRAEVRARQATAALEEAIKVRDSMLAVVSHDLRNPLNAFATSLALLEEVLPEKQGTVRRTLDAMDRSIDQMNRLLGDLLDVARVEGGRLDVERETVSLQDLVNEAHGQFLPQARERGIELRSEIDARCREIRGDRRRLLQVLSHLLGNALRVTAEGGTVGAGCRWVEGPPGRVRLFVTDTGPGIADEELPHLFEPFWQSSRTARGGAGLGLAIARGIAEAHGGELGVRSRLGEGSTFYLEIPTAAPVEIPGPAVAPLTG